MDQILYNKNDNNEKYSDKDSISNDSDSEYIPSESSFSDYEIDSVCSDKEN